MTFDTKKIQFLRNLFWPFLFPITFLWTGVSLLRAKLYSKYFPPYRSSLKVICVGNIHSGGSGKTPIVAEIAKHFRPLKPVILARGYKAKLSSRGARVDALSPQATSLYGDEPVWLARSCETPVYIHRNRVQGVRQIEASAESGFVLLDDGFQHHRLGRNCDLVAIRTNRSIEDTFCLPLGDLREPLSALARASAVLLVMEQAEAESATRWEKFLAQFPTLNVFKIARTSTFASPPPTERIAAFCGIAHPESFFASLSSPVVTVSFSDHHRYSDSDLTRLKAMATKAGAGCWVTTEKDRVKLTGREALLGYPVITRVLHHEFPQEFWYFLEQRLTPA